MLRSISLTILIALVALPASAQANGDTQHKQHHFPHPINTTMGIPDPVGSYNIRLNVFRQQTDAGSEYDLSGHLGYGMFEWGGIHLRSLGVKTFGLLEIIGMVGLWETAAKANGLSALAILGVPTADPKKKGHGGFAYLAGLAARTSYPENTTHDIILHYDFTAGHFIAESGSVIHLIPGLFGVVDFSATVGKSSPLVTILPGLKISPSENLFVGFGYRFHVSTAKDFSNQLYLQFELSQH